MSYAGFCFFACIQVQRHPAIMQPILLARGLTVFSDARKIMPKLAIPLTDAKVQAIIPRDNPYKLGDGGGLYLYVQPSGSRSWYMSYQYLGERRRLVLGAYPDVSLAMARTARDRIRRLLAEGQDPAVVLREERMRERERQATGRAFRLALNEVGELTIEKPHSCMRLNVAQVAALRAFLRATNDGENSQGE